MNPSRTIVSKGISATLGIASRDASEITLQVTIHRVMRSCQRAGLEGIGYLACAVHRFSIDPRLLSAFSCNRTPCSPLSSGAQREFA
jgi:hypothetical protein